MDRRHGSYERILAAVGLPSVAGLLAAERLRFLGQLHRSGPDAAFALLQHSQPALTAFWEAGRWFSQAVLASVHVGEMATDLGRLGRPL